MYQPRHFREEDRERLRALMTTYSFATLLVAKASGELEIAHVPVACDGTRIRLHVAMANAIWRAALAVGKVTVVFAGPHGYVSASWYEEPARQVPTWNYAVVHAHGTARRMEARELSALLDDLVAANESVPPAWTMSGLDAKVREELLLAIVGLSIDVETLEGKFKLSQNRSEADHARVVEALRQRDTPDDRALVTLMSPEKSPR